MGSRFVIGPRQAEAPPAQGAGIATTRYTPSHYVTVAGAGSHNGSLGNEWTYDEALQNAPAGARVRVAPGVYQVTLGDYTRSAPPVINTSGTLENPIVIYAQYPAVYNEGYPQYLTKVISDGTGLDNGPAVGIAGAGRAYHVYDGIWFKQENGSFNPGECAACVCITDVTQAVHFKALRCLFDQENQGTIASTQNWGNVFLQLATDIEFSDCKFANLPIGTEGAPGENFNDENAVSISVYDAARVVMKYCEWDGVTSMFFMKGNHAYATTDMRAWKVHHNYVHHWKQPVTIHLGAVGSNNNQPGEFWDLYQNVFYHDNLGAIGSSLPGMSVASRDVSGGNAPRAFRIVNNTFVNTSAASGNNTGLVSIMGVESADVNWTDAQWRNNIAIEAGVTASRGWSGNGPWDATGISRMVSNNNAWSGFNESVFFSDEGSGSYTRAQWQALGSGRDADSYFGTATLEDPDNGDFRCATAALLQGGANDGVDILNLRGLGTSAEINLGAFILSDQSDHIGIRSQAVTDAEGLNWSYPFNG